MREIKFRAWDKKMNKMRIVESIGFGKPYYSHEGYPVVNMIGRDCINDKDIIIHRDLHQCELMQYTGLKDIKGTKIYEGDIIKYNLKSWLKIENINRDRIAPVYWQEFRGSWAVKESRYCNNDLFTYVQNGNVVEVMGNIYENPELLEVEE